MAWLAVDPTGMELLFVDKPYFSKTYDEWLPNTKGNGSCIRLTNGSIKELLNKSLNYNDEPVEI